MSEKQLLKFESWQGEFAIVYINKDPLFKPFSKDNEDPTQNVWVRERTIDAVDAAMGYICLWWEYIFLAIV